MTSCVMWTHIDPSKNIGFHTLRRVGAGGGVARHQLGRIIRSGSH